jgi:hypothetical protein
VLVLGVGFLDADAPVSFADAPLSFDWANDAVVGAFIATNPPRIRAPQTVGIFMLASKSPRRDNSRGPQFDIAPVACPNEAGNANMADPATDPTTSATSALRKSF